MTNYPCGVLTVQGLRKAFPARRGKPATVALDGVDLVVPAGAFATVLGPSGSGKTTLLRCIAGFEPPDAGTVTLAGRELVSPRTPGVHAHERGIGIVPQEGALFPHLSVAQNIAFGLAGRSRRAKAERVAALLELVSLPGLAERRPHELSGGQQQRVALARALAPEPDLILLDEPFAALDAQLRAELREEIRDLLRQLGTTAVLVTHDQAEAMTLADHMVVMRAGRVVSAGPPRAIYDSPADAELGRFLGDALVLPGRIDRGSSEAAVHVECALGCLEVGSWHGQDGECQVLIRPEQLTTLPSGQGAGVVGTVTGHSYYGHDALLRVSLPELSYPVAVRVSGDDGHQAGDRVALAVVRPVCTYPPAALPN